MNDVLWKELKEWLKTEGRKRVDEDNYYYIRTHRIESMIDQLKQKWASDESM